MERTHKIWGERYLIREDSTHATSVLILKKNTRCSWHNHQQKYNLFFVVKGQVGIVTEFGESLLTEGQVFTIKPGEYHEFRVYEDSIMVEEMYVEYNEADIQREKLGSKL
jgi:mannose-6-phosphate isomerase-like protein (cupin superfamily)